MRWKSVLRPRLRLVKIAGALVIPAVVWAQAQTAQVIAVRAGRVFDPRSGTNVTNQVVLITGERISDAGPADRVQIPAGARVIDLSQATVLPGLIDGHLHLTDAAGGLQHQMMVALYSATQSLNAGFTTQVVMGSHGGGYADVELRKAIESRLVRGPRLLVAGLSSISRRRETTRFRWTSNRSARTSLPMDPRRCAQPCASSRTTASTISR